MADLRTSNVDKKTDEDEVPVRLCNYTDVYYGDRITTAEGLMQATATPSEIARFRLRHGDVLVTKDSESRGDIAVPAFVARDFDDVLCGYHLALVRPRPSIVDGRYLYYCYLTDVVADQFRIGANGITRYGLSQDVLGGARVPVPSIERQRAIASFLDRETEKIDTLIEKKRRLLELLEEKRTAFITQAVTKGLDPDVPMKDSGVEWIGEIPEHWEVWKSAWLFRIGSGTTPRSQEAGYFGGDVPFVTTSELREKTIESARRGVTSQALEDYSSLKLHERGSLVIAMYGATIGRAGLLGIPATVNQACCVLYNRDLSINRFAYYWFRAFRSRIVHMSFGGGQPNISQDVIRSLRIPVPPSDERGELIRHIEVKLERLECIQSRIDRAISLLREYRTALISAAVTGKIDVRDKVPA